MLVMTLGLGRPQELKHSLHLYELCLICSGIRRLVARLEKISGILDARCVCVCVCVKYNHTTALVLQHQLWPVVVSELRL